MAKLPYEILSKKRQGEPLEPDEVQAVVDGASGGAWSDAQLAAFLMAAAIRGLDDEETLCLTMAMLESGDRWDLASEVPNLVDKHSTGGVGDKVSLVLAPMLAACDIPVVMLTGRALGHTGGTADKLETIPGLDLKLDRQRCLELLESTCLASGIATDSIAPADRHLYRIRDQTATVESIPLIVASILSKKLASGASAIVFDVKTGNGAFMADRSAARELAGLLTRVTRSMGRKVSSLITDMSQPLGNWVGHRSEVLESIECLEGGGGIEVRDLSIALALELISHIGSDVSRQNLEDALSSGRAKQAFERWVLAQGADQAWVASPDFSLAPHEVVIEAPHAGILTEVSTRRLGFLMVAAGAGKAASDSVIDPGVSLRYRARLGQRLEKGDEIARLYLRKDDAGLVRSFESCFALGDEFVAPDLILESVH